MCCYYVCWTAPVSIRWGELAQLCLLQEEMQAQLMLCAVHVNSKCSCPRNTNYAAALTLCASSLMAASSLRLAVSSDCSCSIATCSTTWQAHGLTMLQTVSCHPSAVAEVFTHLAFDTAQCLHCAWPVCMMCMAHAHVPACCETGHTPEPSWGLPWFCTAVCPSLQAQHLPV